MMSKIAKLVVGYAFSWCTAMDIDGGCLVCLEDFDETQRTKYDLGCSQSAENPHVICERCFLNERIKECPLCRARIDKRAVERANRNRQRDELLERERVMTERIQKLEEESRRNRESGQNNAQVESQAQEQQEMLRRAGSERADFELDMVLRESMLSEMERREKEHAERENQFERETNQLIEEQSRREEEQRKREEELDAQRAIEQQQRVESEQQNRQLSERLHEIEANARTQQETFERQAREREQEIQRQQVERDQQRQREQEQLQQRERELQEERTMRESMQTEMDRVLKESMEMELERIERERGEHMTSLQQALEQERRGREQAEKELAEGNSKMQLEREQNQQELMRILQELQKRESERVTKENRARQKREKEREESEKLLKESNQRELELRETVQTMRTQSESEQQNLLTLLQDMEKRETERGEREQRLKEAMVKQRRTDTEKRKQAERQGQKDRKDLFDALAAERLKVEEMTRTISTLTQEKGMWERQARESVPLQRRVEQLTQELQRERSNDLLAQGQRERKQLSDSLAAERMKNESNNQIINTLHGDKASLDRQVGQLSQELQRERCGSSSPGVLQAKLTKLNQQIQRERSVHQNTKDAQREFQQRIRQLERRNKEIQDMLVSERTMRENLQSAERTRSQRQREIPDPIQRDLEKREIENIRNSQDRVQSLSPKSPQEQEQDDLERAMQESLRTNVNPLQRAMRTSEHAIHPMSPRIFPEAPPVVGPLSARGPPSTRSSRSQSIPGAVNRTNSTSPIPGPPMIIGNASPVAAVGPPVQSQVPVSPGPVNADMQKVKPNNKECIIS